MHQAGMTDAASFEAFVRAHQDMVYATAVRLLGSAAEAEDVSQTVFMKAFQHFHEIGGSEAAAGWLRTVTRHDCLNHLSRYRRRWRFFSELTHAGAAEDEDFAASLVGNESPGAALEAADRQQHLEAALRRLPDAQRVPLVLFHFEGTSYQEIAQMLGVSLGKVKTDIHRAREALRKYLSADHATR
jgi:RNA polymerase sigma-70 factor (ECF subfamily)